MNFTGEHIIHEPGNDDAWLCICGNTPIADGFFPCNQEGREMEPVAGWNNLYVCARCGRIVDQHSLNVVAKASIPQVHA